MSGETFKLRPWIVSVSAVAVGVLIASTLSAREGTSADWPQIRGANRDGVASGPSEDGPWSLRIAWRRPIGEGFSGVAIVGPWLYTLEASNGQEYAVSFDAARGSERWRRDLGPAFEESFGNGPRSTPAVADGVVYALSSYGRLVALEARSGEVRWQLDLPDAVGGQAPRFGYSPSPLVEGDLVVLEVGAGDGRSIAAFDRSSGELRWTAHSDRMGYASPIALDVAGERQLVFMTPTAVVGLATTGQERWHWPIAGGSPIDQPISMPVPLASDGTASDGIFVAHRAEGGSALLRLVETEGAFEPQVAWESRFLLNHLSSSVHLDGFLYGFHNAILKCVDAATGRQRWAQRGFGKGSLIAVGGDLWVLADDGQLVGVRATPDSYQETVRIQGLTGRSWTAPSMADRAIYLRNHEEMVRVDLVSSAEATPDRASSTVAPNRRSPQTPSVPSITPNAPDLESVLSGHLVARGGAERLSEIERLRLRGRYAEASVYGDFELLRQRGRRYRFDHRRADARIVRAFNGGAPGDEESGWWIHPDKSPTPAVMPPGELNNVLAEAELHGPLIDPDAYGHQIELIGLANVEGGEAWELRLTRASGAVETWFLDRESYLATQRVSRLWAYDEEWQLKTYYSDYRSVDGLVLPHLIEFEFSSLHWLLRVEQVEINPDFEAETFKIPTDKRPTH